MSKKDDCASEFTLKQPSVVRVTCALLTSVVRVWWPLISLDCGGQHNRHSYDSKTSEIVPRAMPFLCVSMMWYKKRQGQKRKIRGRC